MDRWTVRRAIGWSLIAWGVLGLTSTVDQIQLLLNSTATAVTQIDAAWMLTSSAMYAVAGIATLRDARWPWIALVIAAAVQMCVFVMNLIANPSVGVLRLVQFAFLVPNFVWIWILLSPAVRSAFRPLPMTILSKDSGSPV